MITLQAAFTLGVSGLLAPQSFASQAQAKAPFSDMKSHWAKDSVTWAVNKNIVHGYVDGTFKPNQLVTEAEFLSMFLHSYKPELQNGSTNWAEPYYALAESLNYPVAAFRPQPSKQAG